jgi:hypothetical protein
MGRLHHTVACSFLTTVTCMEPAAGASSCRGGSLTLVNPVCVIRTPASAVTALYAYATSNLQHVHYVSVAHRVQCTAVEAMTVSGAAGPAHRRHRFQPAARPHNVLRRRLRLVYIYFIVCISPQHSSNVDTHVPVNTQPNLESSVTCQLLVLPTPAPAVPSTNVPSTFFNHGHYHVQDARHAYLCCLLHPPRPPGPNHPPRAPPPWRCHACAGRAAAWRPCAPWWPRPHQAERGPAASGGLACIAWISPLPLALACAALSRIPPLFLGCCSAAPDSRACW